MTAFWIKSPPTFGDYAIAAHQALPTAFASPVSRFSPADCSLTSSGIT